jgi:high-affinity nickel-transport protein
MHELPATWTALCVTAVVLGARHGFDADHLATIDGLTRCNARANPALARRAGALFSLGHGAVVLAVALAAGWAAAIWQTPRWLEVSGIAVSVTFLFGLAYLNLRAVWLCDPQAVVAPAGLKGRLLGRFITVRRAWAVAGIGALFALSFDTISLAALFALAAGRFGGLAQALLVAALFVLGMLVVDGINGVWIHRLIHRADRTAAIASRVMALAVAGVSFAVGSVIVGKLLLPGLESWLDGRELLLGAAVVGAVAMAFVVGVRAARPRQPGLEPHLAPRRAQRPLAT